MVINKELLSSNAASLGVDLSEDMLDKFDLLASLLIEQNKTMNLTAITQPNEVVVKHFADSLSLLSAIEVPQGAKVLDLGTGASIHIRDAKLVAAAHGYAAADSPPRYPPDNGGQHRQKARLCRFDAR